MNIGAIIAATVLVAAVGLFIGVFLGVIATVPEWADLAFYARGDSIPIVFAPIWLLHGVSCVSCFVGSLLLSYVIWGTADSPFDAEVDTD